VFHMDMGVMCKAESNDKVQNLTKHFVHSFKDVLKQHYVVFQPS